MNAGLLSGVVTALLLILFLAGCGWAWSRHRHAEFDAAARLPLEDSDPEQRT